MSAKPETVREVLEDRDPNNLNPHVQVSWEDIVGEPEGARGPECAWRVARACFVRGRACCYGALAVLLAPPAALLLGCGFAMLAFEQIWCTGPCLRCAKIYFSSLRTFVSACMAATVAPAAAAAGQLCRHIRLNMRHDAPEDLVFKQMNESTFDGASTSAARGHTSYSHTESNQQDSHFIIATRHRNEDTEQTDNTANADHETSEESETEEKVMAVVYRAGKLAAAYYTLQTGELFILEEIVDRPPEYEMWAALLRQTSPARVLLHGSTQPAFVHAVRQSVLHGTEHGDCKLVFVSAKEYNFEACKRRALTLTLAGSEHGDSERGVWVRSALDVAQAVSVHALGTLLRHLDADWAALAPPGHPRPQYLTLNTISLADIVTVDEGTYRGLQIFSTTPHPSGFKRGARASDREGLSLCRLFSRCSSRVGQSRMRVYLQHPTRDLATLKRRQDVVAFFVRPQNEVVMKNICSCMRFIKNVTGILAKIRALSAKAYQWKSLYNTIYNACLICEMCENTKSDSEFLQQLGSCDNNKLYEMALYMNRIIDFDLSKTERKFTVKAGVDRDLDLKKQSMASLHTLMSQTAAAELARLPPHVEECCMLYLPHLGYLLGVKAWADDLTHDQKQLPDMKFMFQNNDYIHYKSKGCEELDVLIGDTYPEIVAHETRIMMRLTAVILDNLRALDNVIQQCAQLDCLIAIAKVSKEYNYVRPTLTTDNVLSIRRGRHPLCILGDEQFVPNDAGSARGVHVLTGPNSSGKSVYIKMIGLIVYLAHIGSFVPAESAAVCAVARLHSRMQAAECVAHHMSAFLIDLRQMAVCLNSSANSVILIDEFGKGTARADGLALLAACINTLLFQGERCPHAFVSTHYLNIKEYVVDSPILHFLSFEHIIEDGSPVFLYRVRAGEAKRSLAHAVAAASGVRAHVVARAHQVMDAYTNNSLPPPNKKIIEKLNKMTEKRKNDLLRHM